LQAQAALWSLLALETVVVGLFGDWRIWLGLMLLTLPAFAYFVSRQKRNLQSLVVVFLDELAKARQFIKVAPGTIIESKPVARPGPVRVELPASAGSAPPQTGKEVPAA